MKHPLKACMSTTGVTTQMLTWICICLTDHHVLMLPMGIMLRQQTWTERFAGSLIPSVVGRAAAAYDPYAREVETPWEAIQARTPYYSTKLPYKVGANIRGMELPIERQGTPMQRFLSPITVTEEAKEPMKSVIDAELESHRLTQMLNKTKSKAKKEALREHRTSR